CERYGADFLKAIISELPAGYTSSNIRVETALNPDSIREYMKHMEESNIRISAHTLGKILIGSESESVPPGGESLPFFGILKNKAKYKTIDAELKEFFKGHVEMKSASESDQYFGSEIFNHLTNSAREQLIHAINGLPINRPTESIDNDYIKE